MTERGISRRQVMQLGLGAAATAGLVSTAGATMAYAADTPGLEIVSKEPSPTQVSINNAYLFLDPVSYTHLTLPTILRV